jgi:chaperonin GroEL (HSP60 family)
MQSIIELSRTQDEEVDDGTTSVIILGTSTQLHSCQAAMGPHTG